MHVFNLQYKTKVASEFIKPVSCEDLFTGVIRSQDGIIADSQSMANVKSALIQLNNILLEGDMEKTI